MQYHEGFRSQVEEWPTNPVDVFIKYLRTKGPETVVADMGCGDGKIAQELHSSLKIHSFDLVAPNKFITACDIARVPLKAGSVDIVIFCLSLMGVNFMDFLQEAFRILKDGYVLCCFVSYKQLIDLNSGELRIAEVSSRFPDVEEFIETLSSIGFIIKQKDTSNKVFTLFQFKKKAAEKRTLQDSTSVLLKPCLYKKR
jgi:ribosomal RNA-processing protein 8